MHHRAKVVPSAPRYPRWAEGSAPGLRARSTGATTSPSSSAPEGSVISGSEKRSTLAEPAVVKMAAIGSPKARVPTIPEARLLKVDVERIPWIRPFLLMLSRAFSTDVMRTCTGAEVPSEKTRWSKRSSTSAVSCAKPSPTLRTETTDPWIVVPRGTTIFPPSLDGRDQDAADLCAGTGGVGTDRLLDTNFQPGSGRNGLGEAERGRYKDARGSRTR